MEVYRLFAFGFVGLTLMILSFSDMFWCPPKKSAMGSVMSAWDTGWLLAANDSAEDVDAPATIKI